MPAHRSTFKTYVLPALVVTAFLVSGLEAVATPFAGEGLRTCGRSFDPCLIDGLVAEAEAPSTEVPERAFAAQEAASDAPAAMAGRKDA